MGGTRQMELVGGFMIMLLLLGFMLAATWLSLPILLFILHRRLREATATIERLDTRVAELERHLTHHPGTAAPPAEMFGIVSGGMHDTVEK